MPPSALTKTYQPTPLLRLLFERAFENIRVDDAELKRVRELSSTGSVVYVLRNLSAVDFLALDQLTRRHSLPRLRFANDLGLWMFDPVGQGWLASLTGRPSPPPAERLRDALLRGGSAALFLKRPPGMFDPAARAGSGRMIKEGDELVRAVLRLQKEGHTIHVVPLVFLWTRHPDTRGRQAMDFLLGPPEWPNSARTVAQFVANYKRVTLRVGEPLKLDDFLATIPELPEPVQARRLTWAVMRRLERERRATTGPAAHNPDRLRMELLRSRRMRAIIEELAGNAPGQREALTVKADGMLKELQARPDPLSLRALGSAFGRVFERLYAGVEHQEGDLQRIRAASKEGTLVLLPSHKSHIDYMILSHVFFEQNLQMPMIAAGDNLNFFPMGPLFRRAGAFFIRRAFKGDRLYGAVVDAYVRRLIRDGFPIELFLEGGRSRTGKLLPPRLGLLNMIVDAALNETQRNVLFVPVSIGYERIIETDAYTRELTGGEKAKEGASSLLKTSRLLRHRYGRINLQVGEILSLQQLRAEFELLQETEVRPSRRRALVSRVASHAMDEINRVTAVTPGALTALALLSHERRGLTHEQLVERCDQLLLVLRRAEVRIAQGTVTPSGTLRPDAIREAVQLFADADLVDVNRAGALGPGVSRKWAKVTAGPGTVYSVPDSRRFALDTSKNIIVHFFVQRSIAALAALAPTDGWHPTYADVLTRGAQLARLLQHEFRFPEDRSPEDVLTQTLEQLLAEGILVRNGDNLSPGPGMAGWSGEKWLSALASILRNYLEGYRVAARSLGLLLEGTKSHKDLIKHALAVGEHMFYSGELERREAVSMPLLENALRAFTTSGVLTPVGESWCLREEAATSAALQELEDSLLQLLQEAR
jgi:glycerol-3-phosphate O-acyltransferase